MRLIINIQKFLQQNWIKSKRIFRNGGKQLAKRHNVVYTSIQSFSV